MASAWLASTRAVDKTVVLGPRAARLPSSCAATGGVNWPPAATYPRIARNRRQDAGVVAVELGTSGGREQHHRPDEVGEDDHLHDERDDRPDQREYHAAHRPAPTTTALSSTVSRDIYRLGV